MDAMLSPLNIMTPKSVKVIDISNRSQAQCTNLDTTVKAPKIKRKLETSSNEIQISHNSTISAEEVKHQSSSSLR